MDSSLKLMTGALFIEFLITPMTAEMSYTPKEKTNPDIKETEDALATSVVYSDQLGRCCRNQLAAAK